MIVGNVIIVLGAMFLLYLGLQGLRSGRVVHRQGEVETGRRAFLDSLFYLGFGAILMLLAIVGLAGCLPAP